MISLNSLSLHLIHSHSLRNATKTNIMKLHFKLDTDKSIIFCCDPHDVNNITYKEIKDLCNSNNIEWKNQTYTQFITQLRFFFMSSTDVLKFTKEQRVKISKQLDDKCNICKCCIKDTKFDIDHSTPLSKGRTNEKKQFTTIM